MAGVAQEPGLPDGNELALALRQSLGPVTVEGLIQALRRRLEADVVLRRGRR